MITYWYKSRKSEAELNPTEMHAKLLSSVDRQLRSLSADAAYEAQGQYLQRLSASELSTHLCGKFYAEEHNADYVKLMLERCNETGSDSEIIEVIFG